MMAKYARQIAKYLFAKEIKATNIQYMEENKDDQFNSMHSVTPTGQDIGRVLICGTLTEVEDIGIENPYYKGRLVDQTGAISIYVGNYQPDALRVMDEIVPPIHIAVIGKISMFQTEDGTNIPSVRPESITEIDEDTIRTWTFMAAKNLIEHMKGTDGEKARKMATEAYGDVSEEYKTMAVDALKSLLPQTGGIADDKKES